jgi:hypothetical protein
VLGAFRWLEVLDLEVEEVAGKLVSKPTVCS